MWAGQQRATTLLPGGRLQHGAVPAVVEATGKACGVGVARLPGKSWAPPSSTGRWWTWEPSQGRPPRWRARPAAGRPVVGCWPWEGTESP